MAAAFGLLTPVEGALLQEAIDVAVIVNALRALRGGDKLEVRGFGSFRVRQRNARVGRNPKTGDKVEVPAKRVPYFKPSKELKDLINKETGDESIDDAPPSSEAPANG